MSRLTHSLTIQRIRFGKADVHTAVILTDSTSQGLNQAFSSFTHGTKVSTRHRQPKQHVFASSTPFVTGRQYTLIFNGSIRLSGAIGLALSSGPCPISHMAVPGLHALTSPKVIRSGGNLVNDPDNANTTVLLVSAFA